MIAYRWILIIGLTLNTAGLAGANTRHCELAPRQNAYASNAVQSFDLSVESDAVVVTHMKLTDSALLGSGKLSSTIRRTPEPTDL